MYTYNDGNYIYSGEAELSDVLNVESMLEEKIRCIKDNEPYAKIAIRDLENTLYHIRELYFDLEEGN